MTPMNSVITERIQQRLDLLGISAREASLKAGLSDGAIQNLKRNPDSLPNVRTATALAKVLGVSVDWLTGTEHLAEHAGQGAGPAGADEGGEWVIEIDTSGPPPEFATADAVGVRDIWQLPRRFLAGLGIAAGRARIVEVRGDAMSDPDRPLAASSLRDGDRVIIDTTDRDPVMAGAFLVLAPAGYAVRLVEAMLAGGAEGGLRIAGTNPSYGPQHLPADAVRVLGRVKARFCRL